VCLNPEAYELPEKASVALTGVLQFIQVFLDLSGDADGCAFTATVHIFSLWNTILYTRMNFVNTSLQIIKRFNPDGRSLFVFSPTSATPPKHPLTTLSDKAIPTPKPQVL